MGLDELWRRLKFLVGRRERVAELEEELSLHRELRERKLREAGFEPDQSRHLAQQRLGNSTLLKERSQTMWGWNWLDDFGKDLRFSARLLKASPTFTLIVILTIALGIGANTAIFSVMNAVVLRALPVANPQQLVYLRLTSRPDNTSNTGNDNSSFPYYVFKELRNDNKAFSDLMAYVPLGIGKVAVRYGNSPEEAAADMVSGNFFSGLGAQNPTCGRLLTAADETQHAQVAVVGYGYWARRFGKSCAVVGNALYVKGVPFTIVGVANRQFIGVEESDTTDVWVPLQNRPDLNAWGQRSERNYYSDPLGGVSA
jgi:hypothetical protein